MIHLSDKTWIENFPTFLFGRMSPVFKCYNTQDIISACEDQLIDWSFI